MEGHKAPRVGYRYRTDAGDKVRVGYLIISGGKYYLAATEDQVRENVFLARLPQLDPSLLKARPSNGDEVPEYLYWGEVPFPLQE